ncbi:MAG TPA: alpha/beta hydrolase [Solirubrobacterales bacterium]|nr:alpha/beta hydrolase [Solirubrobacterales bacterium]
MATEAAGAAVRRRRFEAAGTSSRLVEAGPEGASTAVAFLHGNPGSSDDWEPLVSAVGGTGMRALAFDLPDFGETIAPAGFEHSVPGYAAFVDAALAALGVERVHLVLHDFGGPIGLYWIAGHADRLDSLTLIDIGILPGYKWHRLARIWRTPVLGEIFQGTATRGAFRFLVNRDEPRGLPRPFVERMFDHYDRRTKRAVLKLYRATDEPGSPDPELLAALRERGELPALVIWGDGDAYLSSSYAERQREFFPTAEVNVLPHSGHWPFVDAPEDVERLLLAFLAKLPG